MGKLKKSEILWPLQIPHGLSWDRTKSFMMRAINFLPEPNTAMWWFFCVCVFVQPSVPRVVACTSCLLPS